MRKQIINFAIIFVIFIIICIAACIKVANNPSHRKNYKIRSGRWRQVESSTTIRKDDDTYAKLIGLGYLQGYLTAPESKNVVVYKKNATYEGINFLVSGHAPEAFLMNMDGKNLHKWHYHNALDIWPNIPEGNRKGASYWRRGYLYKNGNVLAIYEGIGLIKIDKDSNLLWSFTSKRAPHHDLEVVEDGTIYILTREKKKIPRISNANVYDEFITLLDQNGKRIKEFSLIDLIINSPYANLLDRRIVKEGGFYGHILHSNTIEVFDGRLEHKSTLFKRGNVMVSILMLDTICIIDLDKEKLIWTSGSGMWQKQHQPTLLENGNILIFNNKHTANSSQVLEFDLFTQRIIWEYKGRAENKFHSKTCGSNQRLPNGNTLITETDNGRAFEVTKDNEIVWEYINPYRAGDHNELIASLLEVVRINPAHYTFIGK